MFKIAKVEPNAIIPSRANPFDAGMDLSACENTIVPAKGQKTVDTGIAIEFPNDCYARIAPRSGLAHKHGIDVGAGVIDYSYTNKIKVILFNHSDTDFVVNEGDRIAQLIFEKIYIPSNIVVISYEQLIRDMEISNSRGLNGFGSSGVSTTDTNNTQEDTSINTVEQEMKNTKLD